MVKEYLVLGLEILFLERVRMEWLFCGTGSGGGSLRF